jgi:hypothetical protein
VKTILLGLMIGLLAAYPHLAVPLAAGAHWLAAQPLLWAFTAGAIARPRLALRAPWRLR